MPNIYFELEMCFKYVPHFMIAGFQEGDMMDEELDWWSKYYASIGETSKCKKYVQKGLDKIEVRMDLLRIVLCL